MKRNDWLSGVKININKTHYPCGTCGEYLPKASCHVHLSRQTPMNSWEIRNPTVPFNVANRRRFTIFDRVPA